MILPTSWQLPDAVKVRLGQNTYGRQRAIFEEGHLLLVLHRPPGPSDRTREGSLFWRTPRGQWEFNRGAAATAALERQVQSYSELEGQLAHQYEAVETSGQLFALLEALTPLLRSARNQHLALQNARDGLPTDPFLIEVRDLAYEVERNLELLTEDVRNAIQYRQAREAESTSQSSREALQASHRLNTLAAWFFPLTALTSVFGMNLPNGVNQWGAWLFWLLFAGGVGLGFLIKGWVVGRPDQSRHEPPPVATPTPPVEK